MDAAEANSLDMITLKHNQAILEDIQKELKDTQAKKFNLSVLETYLENRIGAISREIERIKGRINQYSIDGNTGTNSKGPE